MDATNAADVGDSGSGMGIASGDYDLDGFPDLLVTNWHAELNALYRSEGLAAGTLPSPTPPSGLVSLASAITRPDGARPGWMSITTPIWTL